MAANSNVLFPRLFEQLVSVYGLSVACRKHCEQVVSDCRELLRPWSKKSPSESGVESDASNSETEKQPKKNSKKAKGKDGGPAADLAALELAERILSQAHRLREKQAKLVERETSRQGHGKPLSDGKGRPPFGRGLKHKESPTTKEGLRSTLSMQNQISSSSKNMSTKPLSRTATTNSSAQGHSEFGRKPYQGQSVRSESGLGTVVSETSKGACGKQENNKDGNETVGIISESALKRVLDPSKPTAKANTVKIKPAHMDAPFRTQVSVSRITKSRPTQTSEFRQANASDLGANRTLLSNAGRGPPGNIQARIRNSTHPESTSYERLSADGVISRVTIQRMRADATSTPPPEVNWTTNAGSCSLDFDDTLEAMSSSVLDPVELLSAMEKQKQKETFENQDDMMELPPFELLVDGHTLTLPSKYRKAMSLNNKLRRQLEMTALTVQTSHKNSPTSSYLNKLAAHYDSTVDTEYKEIVQMLALYTRLTMLMDKLNKRKYDGGSTLQEVLRAKRTIENICLLYSDMENSYLQCVGDVDRPSPSRWPSPIEGDIRPPMVWLPAEIPADLPNLPAMLRYRRLQDAERYLELLHEVQLLNLRRHVTATMADDLLPLLDTMDGAHSSFPSLYRAAYSLLCTDRPRQPIIIRDID